MGLQQKKQREVIDDLHIIGRGEGPDGDGEPEFDLVAGQTAEDISGTTAAKDADAEYEPDPELVGDFQDDGDADGGDAEPEGAAPAAAAAAVTAAAEGPGKAGKKEARAKGGAKAEPAASAKGGDGGDVSAPKKGSKVPKNHGAIFAAVAVAAVIAAAIIGYFVGNGGFGAKATGTPNLTKDQLSSVVATWDYNGKKNDITAQEALESQYSLDSVKNDDDTYPAPSSSVILQYIQNEILLEDAEKQGIEVSDDEAKEVAEQTLGSSDYATIATQYGVSKDQAKEIVKRQAIIQKLYTKVVGDQGTQPEAPTQPADGNDQTASKEYADYIINLAGDEWDADKGTWASEEGTIAKALKGEQFTADSATYAQAETAYYAALQDFSSKSSEASTKWKDYVNGLTGKASIRMYGLYA